MGRLTRWAWLPVAIPIAILFGPALVTDTSFSFRDAGHFYHPLFQWCADEWGAGRVPLWNPDENCGVSVLADATSSVFYPGKLLFALPLDFALLYKLYVVLHVVLAAVSSFMLARVWKCSPAAAALAAIAYACGGGVVFQYCNVVFLVGAAWLPLAALCTERMLRQGSWRAAGGLGVVLALMILGGDPQAAVHSVLIAALYAAILSFRSTGVRPSLTKRATLVVLAAVVAMALAAVQVLPSAEATRSSERAVFNRPRNLFEAVSVAAQSPFLSPPLEETRAQSIVRGLLMTPEVGSHHDQVYDFSVGPWRLVEYIWPNVAGRMFPANRRWMSLIPAEGRIWTPTLYLGLLPVVLAIYSFRLWSGDARQRWLSWIAILFTLGSFGYYGVGWLLQELGMFRESETAPGLAPGAFGVYWFFVTFLPSYVYFRYPAKLLPVVSLAIGQLAAQSLDRMDAGPRSVVSRALFALGIVSGCAAGLVWLGGDAVYSRWSGADTLLGPFDADGARRDLMMAFVHTAVVAAIGRAVLLGSSSWPASRAGWQLAAVVLTGLEVAIANYWLVATAPADIWRRGSAVATAIHEGDKDDQIEAGSARVIRGNLATWRPIGFRSSGSADRLAALARWEHDTLFPKHHLGQNISLIESFGSIKSADYQSLLKVAKQHGPAQPDKSLLPQPTLLRLLGTKYLVLPDRQNPEFADRVPPAEGSWPESTALWKLRRTMPRAWIVREVDLLPPLSAQVTAENLDRRSYEVLFPGAHPRDFSRSAVIEDAHPTSVSKSTAAQVDDHADRLSITHYEPQRASIEADLEAAGLFVLSDAWYSGWRATVTSGGEPREAVIHRTNRVMRGIWLPAGKITVELRFWPVAFYRGATISSAVWLLLLLIVSRHFYLRLARVLSGQTPCPQSPSSAANRPA